MEIGDVGVEGLLRNEIIFAICHKDEIEFYPLSIPILLRTETTVFPQNATGKCGQMRLNKNIHFQINVNMTSYYTLTLLYARIANCQPCTITPSSERIPGQIRVFVPNTAFWPAILCFGPLPVLRYRE